ncbi:MAG: hypothetical protein KA807_07190 [Prolixibacteraceae bacterium]|nr:hypothetical protein [Prolixibacteraceae bacterium]
MNISDKLNNLPWITHFLLQKITSSLIRRKSTDCPVHIMFSIVDHFEPFNGNVDFERARNRIKVWTTTYPDFIKRFSDADGRFPQHTWFYPPHHNHIFLEDLLKLCKQGLGEIEMHLHHNHMEPFPDTSETLKVKILKCIDDYSKYKIFCLPDGAKKFAFIHGDWALDNARGNTFCGVNNEIDILQELGCYADFTFPSLGLAQPIMINKMFYATDNPQKPKSYNWGQVLKRNVINMNAPGLLMISGIIGIRKSFRSGGFPYVIEASNIDNIDSPSRDRVDYWVKNGVFIGERNDWVFIKLHTHGAREETWDSLFGDSASEMYQCLLNEYNDKKKYFLHFVSAREMYNTVKALEQGKTGNPNNYRDFLIAPYEYLKR